MSLLGLGPRVLATGLSPTSAGVVCRQAVPTEAAQKLLAQWQRVATNQRPQTSPCSRAPRAHRQQPGQHCGRSGQVKRRTEVGRRMPIDGKQTGHHLVLVRPAGRPTVPMPVLKEDSQQYPSTVAVTHLECGWRHRRPRLRSQQQLPSSLVLRCQGGRLQRCCLLLTPRFRCLPPSSSSSWVWVCRCR